MTYTCTVCGETKTETVSVTDEHTWSSWEKDDETNHKHICSVCGKEETAAHSWDEGKVTTEPTHTEFGVKTYTCSVCNATKTEQVDKLPEHTYGAWEKYDEAQHKRTCACGDVQYADHTWDDGEVTTEPTSSSQGVKTYTCTACGATKTETIPPTTIYSGTCGADGDNLTWIFDSTTGKLTISGTGNMADYDDYIDSKPWYSYRGLLKIVEITEGVTSIGSEAFYACGGLTSVEIPSSVTSIGDRAFTSCHGLESIEVEAGNRVYHSEGNCLIETASKTLIAGCKNSVIPTDGSVTSIGNYAFSGCWTLTSIEIPSSVTSIGDYAFSWCDGLTSIVIPKGVTSIGSGAFDGCSSLESITILSRDVEIYDSSSTIPSTATIYGYADSTAQAYAEKYDRKFIPLVVGDLNGDNILDSDDAVYLLWHTFMPDDYPIYSDCDFNQDDVVDSNDAIYLLWHTFMPDVYPIK